MPGSLDDNPPRLFGAGEYEFAVLCDTTGIARVYLSKSTRMSPVDVADKLRTVADWIGRGECGCGDSA